MEFVSFIRETLGSSPLCEAVLDGYAVCNGGLRPATKDELYRMLEDASEYEHQVYRKDWEENYDSIMAESNKFADDVIDGSMYALTKTGNDIVIFGPSNGVIFIAVLYIGEELRGKGLGTQLLQHVIDFAGDNTVRLCVAKNNEIAKGLYRKMGFHITGQNEKQYQMERTPDSVEV